MPGFDIAHRILDQGQGLQAQEIHLEQAGVLHHRVVKLGAPHGGILGHRDRYQVGDVLGGDDDPASVDPGVAHRPFDHARFVDRVCFQAGLLRELFELVGFFEVLVAEFGFEAFVVESKQLAQLDVWQQFGNAIGVWQGQFQHAPGVADGGLGRHGTVGDDLCYLVLPVFVDHVPDHAVTAFVVEVDIDIRQRHTLRVEETLKQQVVLDGVDVGDAQAIGHSGTRS